MDSAAATPLAVLRGADGRSNASGGLLPARTRCICLTTPVLLSRQPIMRLLTPNQLAMRALEWGRAVDLKEAIARYEQTRREPICLVFLLFVIRAAEKADPHP